MHSHTSKHDLFGGESGWDKDAWTDSDDRVRGGKSKSCMQFDKTTATFYGNLDIETLGGAGFASQRTAKDDTIWNLASYDGILLTLHPTKSDSKCYTFILKDEILPKDPETGRERSTISWEYEFRVQPDSVDPESTKCTDVRIPWDAFTPMYRGKQRQPDHPLNTASVKRMSIMMRSFFGTQQGTFKLCLEAISTYHKEAKSVEDRSETGSQRESDSLDSPRKQVLRADPPKSLSIWSRLSSLCCSL